MRTFVWFHRWLGIATCSIFALWFASGAVMVFHPFPVLPLSDQMAMAAAVDNREVRVSPAKGWAAGGDDGRSLRLVQRADGPVYLLDTGDATAVIDARSGDRLDVLTRGQASDVALKALGHSPADLVGLFDYDQWIAHNRFDPMRPFYRIDVGDAAGTQLYLSARTGEILQRTYARERAWNWVGAVLHWVYFTPLRKSYTAWDQSVWWLSFLAMLVAAVGIVLGITRTIAARRTGRRRFTYFRQKWMRWHHLLGLGTGFFVLTWIMSGWLSMDHGRLFSTGKASDQRLSLYAGPMPTTGLVTLDRLRAMPPARQIALSSVNGTPLMTLSDASGTMSMFGPSGPAMSAADRRRLILKGLRTAWAGADIAPGHPVRSTDLYALAEGMPAAAHRFEITGEATTIYVDGDSGKILTVMDASRAAYAWLYFSVHTFSFPGLIERPMLRQGLILFLLVPGFMFSVTGAVIGFRRLQRVV